MKKKILAMVLATAFATTLFAGCGASKSASADASSSADTQEETTTESTSEEATASTVDESTLSDSSDNMTAYDNGVFSFKYNPDYIAVFEYDDPVVTVANFYHEGTEISGTNAISIEQVENADAKTYLAENYCEKYGDSADKISEGNFGGGDYTAYSYAPVFEDTSYGVPTYFTIQNGDDILFITVDSTREPDEETMYLISDTISGVLDTFTLD